MSCDFPIWEAVSTPQTAGTHVRATAGTAGSRSAWRAGGGSLGLLHTRALIVTVHAPPRQPTTPPPPSPQPPPPPAQSEGRGERSCALAPAPPAGERSRRTALAISHQMSPSAAKAAPGAQTMAKQAQGWAGPAPGPQSRASADTYSLEPNAAYLSPRATPAAAAIPLALCPPATISPISPPVICSKPHSAGGRADVTSSRKPAPLQFA